jgi:UDP-N-acetyl-D-mannosaminuronic acid dehydrogenase
MVHLPTWRMRNMPWRTGARVLIIGLGQIGYSNAEYLKSRRLIVDGYDIDEKAVQRALDNDIIRRKAETFREYDYYVICVSTHRPENMFMPFPDGIFSLAHKLSHEGRKGSLVAIESTIAKGTCRKVMKILGHRLHVAHVPHRFYAKEKKEHGVKQVRVIGGCEKCCTEKAVHFYGDLLKIPLHLVSSIELAELSKIVENSYRFLEIAFAEELKMFCDAYAVDYNQLKDAINSKWNVKILEAQKGIGGHCLPKDTEMYLDLLNRVVRQSMVETAKKIDYLYKLHLTQKIRPKIGIPMTEKPLAKMGLNEKVLSTL